MTGIALTRLAQWTQHHTWRSATKCLPVTHVLADYLFRAGVAPDDVVVIPNGVNLDNFADNTRDVQTELRVSLDIDDALVLQPAFPVGKIPTLEIWGECSDEVFGEVG